MKYTKRFSLLLIATVLSIPFLIAYAAGGRIEGKITDPKGAAFRRHSDHHQPDYKQDFTRNRRQGQYKVEGLPPVPTSSGRSKGFNEGRREM